jgi:hypothetical protein
MKPQWLLLILMLGLVAPMGCRNHASQPESNPADLLAHIQRLEHAGTPAAAAVLQWIEAEPRDLQSERAAARREGLPLSPSQLQAPLPPASQNAAPLYTRLTAVLKARPLNEQAKKLATRFIRGEKLSPDEVMEVRRLLAERRDVMDLSHAAARRPSCVFRRDWSLGPELPLPEFAPMREAVRMLTAESLMLARDGRYRESIANQSLGLQIAEHAGGEPGAISFLVGVACRAIALAGFEQILLQVGPNAEAAEAVRRSLAQHPVGFRMRRALGGEIVMSAILCQEMQRSVARNGAGALASVLGASAPDLPPIPERKLSPREERQVKRLLEACEADWLRRLRRMIALQSKPAHTRLTLYNELAAPYARIWDDPTLLVSAILFPVIRPADEKGVTVWARGDVAIAAAALLAYKARHGAFPERMEGTLLPLPLDPFTGRPIGYRREGEGFVVYSVGPRGDFDGGQPNGEQPKGQTFFRYPAQPVPSARGA